MQKLLDNDDLLKKSALLHSAVHLTMGRIIGEVCGNVPVLRTETEKPGWLRSFQKQSRDSRGLPKCPEENVMRVLEVIIKNRNIILKNLLINI